MSSISSELQHFYQFAEVRLREPTCAETLDDIYAEWRARNPLPDELEKDTQAVRASLRDMDAGETGRSIDDFAKSFRQANGI